MLPIIIAIFGPAVHKIHFFFRLEAFNRKRIFINLIADFPLAINQFSNNKCRIEYSFFNNCVSSVIIIAKEFWIIVLLYESFPS